MKKVFKKSIACLIAVLMVFSTMPLSAFAWDISNLTFVKKDTSWDGYDGKYSAYVHNGTSNDFIGIVLKEVSSDGVIYVKRGSGFQITLSCGTWTSSTASNGTLPNNTLSWHYGNSTDYTISSVDNNKSGLTNWKAFLGNDTTTPIQSAVEGEFATADTPSDSFRARASEGGTNEAYGIIKFTTDSFPQLKTVGEYTIRFAPTLVMNKWNSGWTKQRWEPKYGWGNYDWSIGQGSPDTSRTIPITVKVYEDYDFVNAAGTTVKTVTTTIGATDAYNQRPANTSTKYLSNGDGTHDVMMYSWPSSPSGTTFTEATTSFSEGCMGGTATCVSKKVCTACLVEYGNVNSSNHTKLIQMAGKDATCSTDGYSAYQHCNDCGVDVGKTTISATGNHNYSVLVSAKQNATCTQAGKEAVYKCSTCELTSGGEVIPATGHTEVIDKAVAATCTTTGLTEGKHCSVCNEVIVAQTETPALGHDMQTVEGTAKAPTCTVDGKEADKACSRCDYTEIGATIPATGSHDYDVVYDSQTNTDIFTCKNCGDTYSKTVADMSALNAAIKELEALVYADGASYKYEANTLNDAKRVIAVAKAYAENSENRYEQQTDVNAQAATVNEAITTLTTTGLAKYTITVKVVNSEDENDQVVKGFEKTYTDVAYGSTFDYSFEIPTIDDGSSLSGLPKYAVYKWMVGDVKLNTTDTSISGVVKGNVTYICYVLNFKASTESDTEKTTRVRYLDKSGHTIDFDTATVGTEYAIKESVAAPKIPYYVFDGWKCVFGTPDKVGTREIVYQAKYKYDDNALSNKCTIVGLNGVKVNNADSCESTYDSKVILTGATKYAFSDSTGKIISYINADYIFTPHINNETIYITAFEDEVTKATTAITGHFVQTNAGTLDDGRTYHNLYVNAQFYLPEGASVVEAGLVLSKTVSTESELQIGKDKVTKLISTSESPNHEYSMAMSFVAKGTVNARSYLIYVDKNGTTYTVYSTVNTISYSA